MKSEDDPWGAAVQIQLQNAAIGPALPRKQPALVDGDGVGTRQVCAHDFCDAVWAQDADPAFGDFGGENIALGIEHQIVGGNDVPSFWADGFDVSVVDVDSTDLAARYLGYVNAPVRAGTDSCARSPRSSGAGLDA